MGSVCSPLPKDFVIGWTVGVYSASINSLKKESWVDFSSDT